MNLKAPANVAGITILNAHHRQPLQQAAIRILHTDRAEDTYAELLDGMPTTKTYRECFVSWKTHPSSRHSELCPGVRDKPVGWCLGSRWAASWPEIGDQLALLERREGRQINQESVDRLERSIKLATPSSPLWDWVKYKYGIGEQMREKAKDE
ncbi:hypothetical protein ACRE_042810 [Hapsidospora chrysogenum ATCC 11550]|uniref:Uncharacterized protein n=1 Tax=Hapsidospora chrysogenum (strain ATCC 11550 / CBS 779.69 / DSM 880 / IAM 14645 / JCM 23072 / IMI 49137) TaxID=857340 RepID=A0A086T6G9_HAPC1|nr:hypothetical protein ACRE_042810 [Hapsidospora chrysogenum ATCC 11550]